MHHTAECSMHPAIAPSSMQPHPRVDSGRADSGRADGNVGEGREEHEWGAFGRRLQGNKADACCAREGHPRRHAQAIHTYSRQLLQPSVCLHGWVAAASCGGWEAWQIGGLPLSVGCLSCHATPAVCVAANTSQIEAPEPNRRPHSGAVAERCALQSKGMDHAASEKIHLRTQCVKRMD